VEGGVLREKIVFLAEPGEELAEKVRSLLERENFELLPASPLPAVAGSCLLVVILSPGILADHANDALLQKAADGGFVVLPVALELATFSFASLPFAILRSRNAVGFEVDGANVLAAVRQQLGEEARPRHRQVFISYSRTDGQRIAEEVAAWLEASGYRVFIDLKMVEGGGPFQEILMAEILDIDFVLLIDTVAARTSKWVRLELLRAMSQRVPVGGILVDQLHPHPLLQDLDHLDWQPKNPQIRDLVLQFVSASIGARASFDDRCQSIVRSFIASRGLAETEVGRRMRKVRRRRLSCLIEWERKASSLERVYRLHRDRLSQNCQYGLLVSGDRPVDPFTHEAVTWAGRGRLRVTDLTELFSVLEDTFR
jgi:hypothetical protein